MLFIDRLVAVFAPHECLVCGVEGTLLCAWCAQEHLLPVPDRCYRCGAVSADARVCAKCRRKGPLRHVWVATEYDGAAKQLVHRLKFERVSAAAPVMAAVLHDRLPHIANNTIIVPIPTAAVRVRQRGYDQAVLVARAFAKKRQLTVCEALVRMGATRQVGATRARRQEQMLHAFRVSMLRGDMLRDRDVLLVDDITTTGTTLESAARAVRAAGASSVSAAVFAQKR